LNDRWFWLSTVRRNRLLNTLYKILSVSPMIAIGELRTALRRHHRMTGISVPQRVLAQIIAKLPDCVVEGETVICKSPVRPEDVLSPLELKFYRAFQEHGPILRLDALERILIGSGMNGTSFYIYLGNCPLIVRLRVAVYALVGASIRPGMLNDREFAPLQKNLFAGNGWCKSGEVWLAYKLTYSNLSSGSFGIPASLRDLLQGSYELVSEDGGEFGGTTVRDTFMYGLAKFFTRRGGEPGDYVVLVIDLHRKIVTALLGDDDLVERFERGEDFGKRQLLGTILGDIGDPEVQAVTPDIGQNQGV